MSSSLGLGALAVLSKGGKSPETVIRETSAVSYKVRGGSFNIHVGDAARGREEGEQLIRYCARAPLSLERLSVSEDGKIVYQLKHPIQGRTHRVMEPHQFFARLCALIPPPRHPLIRFDGVFGPASKWRADVVPPPPNQEITCDESEAIENACHEGSRWQSQRLDWATLLHRVYDIDALRCECGGDIRFEELVEEPKKAQAFLKLHDIESPRGTSSREHVKPWTDAPNIAFVSGLRLEQEAEAAKQSALQGSTAEAEPTHSDPREDLDFQDDIPPEDAYFQDEVPPD